PAGAPVARLAFRAAYHFTMLYVRAHLRDVLLGAHGGTGVLLYACPEQFQLEGLLRCRGPHTMVTPCGGRRRVLLAVAGSDSVRPADCLVGGIAAHACARRGTVGDDPQPAGC